MNGVSVGEDATSGANENAQAGLLENLRVVVVGVAHGPAGRMPPRFFAVGPVHQPTVTVRPLLPPIVLHHLNHNQTKNPGPLKLIPLYPTQIKQISFSRFSLRFLFASLNTKTKGEN